MFVVTGPTASGKTTLAKEWASLRQFTLVNADAFQFYKELKIISNREALSGPSQFFGEFSLCKEIITAGDFGRMTLNLLSRSDRLMVGTGLYIGAALYGLDDDRKKGTPFQNPPRAEYKMIVLDPHREELYEKINYRVDQMILDGAVEEAKRIFELRNEGTILPTHPALQAIGLKHLLQMLDEKLTEAMTIDLWKRDTRRLAKRQWTWLRKFCAPSQNRVWIKNPKEAPQIEFWDQ